MKKLLHKLEQLKILSNDEQKKYIKNNILEKYNLRFLFAKNDYDYSQRTDKGDKDSIENCENTDYKYFVQYVTGYNVTFEKNLNEKRAVSNN